MRFPTTEGVYRRLPVAFQDAAVSVQGARVLHHRHGRRFEAVARSYFERDSWPEERVLEYRDARRAIALEQASRTPYYRELFDRLGGRWEDFLPEEAWVRLPIITKDELLKDIDRFRPRPALRSDHVARSSGTTGASLSLPKSANVNAEQWAVWWRYRGWHGISRRDLCGVFTPTEIPIHSGANTRPWRRNIPGREIRFSIFHINERMMPQYIEALERFKPVWIHGNPSALALLATLFIEQGCMLSYELKHVTVGAENLQTWQGDCIRDAFGVSPVQHYGLTEAVANLSECECGNLHVDEDFAFVEFVDDPYSTRKEIVGTCFCNGAVSLVRYATNDLATPLSDGCPCGRWGRVVESLDGRLTEYVTLPGGQRVARLDEAFHYREGLAGAQIRQVADGSLIVLYVPTERWGPHSLVSLEDGLRMRVGHEVPINFEQVAEIPRTARGKTRVVVSEYAQDQGSR